MERLLSLPNEMIISIANSLESFRDINAFARVNQQLLQLLDPFLYQRDRTLSEPFALHWACFNNKLSTVKKCLDAGAIINQSYPWTPRFSKYRPGNDPSWTRPSRDRNLLKIARLQQAARRFHNEVEPEPEDIMTELRPDSDMKGGYTALHIAAANGHLEIVRHLHSTGQADMNAVNLGIITPLAMAVYFGHQDIVHFFTNLSELHFDIQGESSFILELALKMGHMRIIETLLGYPYQQSRDCGGYERTTPYLWLRHPHRKPTAADLGIDPKLNHVYQAQRRQFMDLIIKDPTITAQSKRRVGLDMFQLSSDNGLEEDLEILLRGGFAGDDYDTLLDLVVRNGQPRVISMLLNDFGADINRDQDGHTPLISALRWEKHHIADLLIDHGADLSIGGHDGYTLLHYACEAGHVRLVQALLDRGANPNAVEELHDETPLHLASYGDHTEAVTILIQHGADPAMKTIMGVSPYDYAASVGSAALIKEFIALVPDSHNRLQSGRTPLHHSCFNNLAACVALLEHGANVNAMEPDGRTPLHEAVRGGKIAIVKTLLAYGADTKAVRNDGKTPLSLAEELEFHEIASVISARDE